MIDAGSEAGSWWEKQIYETSFIHNESSGEWGKVLARVSKREESERVVEGEGEKTVEMAESKRANCVCALHFECCKVP